MNLKKLIALLFLVITVGFFFFVKPSTANAANFYGCTGRISNTYNSYACYFTNYAESIAPIP
jgi:Na+(H+)/acetate symporter ActP